MHLIYHPVFLKHETGNHPECPQRLSEFTSLPASEIKPGLDYVTLVHPQRHVEAIREASAKAKDIDSDTRISINSYEAALAAVGAAVTAVELNGFALVRPPGHHAFALQASGFCLFNNIAVAAQYLCEQGKKVLILDIDGHQGNGTSHIFYESDQVLFCSIHQYPAYPGTGWLDEYGTGAGKGYTLNIPLPPGSADDIFQKSLDLVLEIALQFQPDVVGVSAGFDALQHDPLLQLRYSLSSFYQCGKWVNQHFDQVFAVLEGGYNLDMLPKAIYNFVDGYNGRPCKYQEPVTISETQIISKFEMDFRALKALHREFWSLSP